MFGWIARGRKQWSFLSKEEKKSDGSTLVILMMEKVEGKRLKVNNIYIYIIHMLFLFIITAKWTSVHPYALLVRPEKSKVHCEDKIDRSINQSKIPVSTDTPPSSQDRRRNDISFVRSDTPLQREANSFVKSEIKRWQYLHLPGMNGQNKLWDSYLRSKLATFIERTSLESGSSGCKQCHGIFDGGFKIPIANSYEVVDGCHIFFPCFSLLVSEMFISTHNFLF